MQRNLANQTLSRRTTSARAAPRKASRAAAASRVNAFVDRLLYADWLEDERLDRMKLAMIRAIAEWARSAPPPLRTGRMAARA